MGPNQPGLDMSPLRSTESIGTIRYGAERVNGRQALNLKIGDPVVRGDLTGRVVNKERLFVTIRWDDGTVTSTHRYDMDDINRPSPPKPPPGNTVAIIKRLQNGEIYSEIAKRYGVTRQRVQFIAKRAGIHRHQKPKRRQVIDALQAGENYAQIAERIGVSVHYVNQTALDEGLRKDGRSLKKHKQQDRGA